MTGPTPSHLVEVGRVSKPHGVRGEVVLELLTERLERVSPGARLYAGPRTLVVATAKASTVPQKSRRAALGSVYFVRFEGVEDRDTAALLRGTVLTAEPLAGALDDEGGGRDVDADDLWVEDLVGRSVVEADGTERGRVVSVEANPASDLLVLESGALVPLTFVVSVGAERIDIDAPAGLFDV